MRFSMEYNLLYKIYKFILEDPKLLFFFSLVFLCYVLVIFFCTRNKTRFTRSILIGALSSIIPWFLMINPIRTSYHTSEGWQKGLSISFGIIETLIYSASVFFIMSFLAYFIEKPSKKI